MALSKVHFRAATTGAAAGMPRLCRNLPAKPRKTPLPRRKSAPRRSFRFTIISVARADACH
jgi:hypothetical protein